MTNELGTIAFILYRQHHQAAVVAQHPGLPNPEISKILGEQWRNLPAQTKAKWQALAEVSSTPVP
jgi:HMG box factor